MIWLGWQLLLETFRVLALSIAICIALAVERNFDALASGPLGIARF